MQSGAHLQDAPVIEQAVLVVVGSDKTKGVNLAPVSFGFIGTLIGATIGALRGGKHRGELLYQSK